VYRVYGEDEFFADSTPHAEHLDATRPGGADVQLQRLAGATVLLAVVGAVGAAIVITSVSSIGGARRRGGVRPSASSGSPVPSGERVGLMHESPTMPSATRRPAGHAGGPRGYARAPKRQLRSRRPGVTLRGHRALPLVAVAETVSVADSAQAGQRVDAQEPPSAAAPATGSPATAPQPGQVEFGFER
jgi:hypothetical protein